MDAPAHQRGVVERRPPAPTRTAVATVAVAYERVTVRTEAAFGVAVPPHRFRDSAVTSLGEEAPELVWLAPALLHHADLRIAEKHYDLARDAAAVTTWQRLIRAHRRNARLRTRRSRSGASGMLP